MLVLTLLLLSVILLSTYALSYPFPQSTTAVDSDARSISFSSLSAFTLMSITSASPERGVIASGKSIFLIVYLFSFKALL